MNAERRFDVVVWGATGFTGRLVAKYLAEHAGPTLRWAIGGRSKQKLEEIRSSLPATHSELPLLVHDATSSSSMTALAREARVICTTVGPYARHGKQLARACAAEGTDYCDLTGEPPFIRWSIDELHVEAERTGARIVHTCGFDSIPSDLGVLLLAEKLGGPLETVRFVLTDSRGGLSGGTIASALGIAEDMQADPKVRRVMKDPSSFDPGPLGSHPRTRRKGPPLVHYNADLEKYVAPFPMAAVNERVVRRSNRLQGDRYGEDFDYRESMVVGSTLKGLPAAVGVTLGLGGFALLSAFKPTRDLLQKALPKPGEGPSERSRARGFFKCALFAKQGDRTIATAHVEGTSDPGYGETAKMLGEAAMCLAQDPRSERFRGGVLTPATAMGMALVERLRKAGMRFEVV